MRVFVFTFVNTCKCILHTYAAFKQIHTATLPSMIDILSTKTLMSSTRIAVVPQKPAIVGGWTNPSEKYARQIGSFPQSLNHHQDILLESHHEYLLRTVRFGLVFLLARLGFSKKTHLKPPPSQLFSRLMGSPNCDHMSSDGHARGILTDFWLP